MELLGEPPGRPGDARGRGLAGTQGAERAGRFRQGWAGLDAYPHAGTRRRGQPLGSRTALSIYHLFSASLYAPAVAFAPPRE